MIDITSFSILDKRGDRLLDDIDLNIDTDELTVICGRPGSGKTLLLKAIKGIVSEGLKHEGKIETEGRIGLIFQEPRKQLVRRNVKMEAAFDLENLCYERREIESKIHEFAKFLDAEYLLEKDIDEVSHGEMTKIALLSTMVTHPEIILFDEPLSTLDHTNRKMLLELIRRLKQNGTSIVIAEHDLRDIVGLSDRIILLRDGKISCDGRPKDLKKELHREGVKIPFSWELEVLGGEYGAGQD